MSGAWSTRIVAARLRAPGLVAVADEALPPAAARDEVLLRVVSVGLCGSDLHWFQDGAIGDARLAGPLVLGHEIGAVIASGPRSGTRVAIDPADPCGTCSICHNGRGELCVNMRFLGHGACDGGLRTYLSWPERHLHPIPDSIGDDEASLLEPLGVAVHAVELGVVHPGMRVAVVGCGPIGLLVIKALRASSIDDITAGDLLPHRVAAAISAGAAHTWLGAPGEVDMADVVFECSGDEPAVETAIRLAGPAGRVVMVGIPGNDRASFRASVARRKQLNLVFCRRMTPPDLDAAIELVADGRVDLAGLITARFGLADAPSAFAELERRSGLKVVVRP